jgi:hypothetical protein
MCNIQHLSELFKGFEDARKGYPKEVVELRYMLVRCIAQEKHLKELLEAKDRDLAEKDAQAKELAK